MVKEQSRKRQRADSSASTTTDDDASVRSISPPVTKRTQHERIQRLNTENALTDTLTSPIMSTTIPSPVQLNRIQALPASSNIDTLTLKDILGDPLISECWLFNYLFDVDFIMSQFDEDVRDSIQVKLVHGSWKNEDSNRIGIEHAMKRYSNVKAIVAHMPEMYGTHHSKMMILFRHDELAQIIILTANFVPGDWMMTQALWRSPLLPLLSVSTSTIEPPASVFPLGSGLRFKQDLLAYLQGYNRLAGLVAKLKPFDFGAVRAALVASLPRKQNIARQESANHLWGLPGLARILRNIPRSDATTSSKPTDVGHSNNTSSQASGSEGEKSAQIVVQISSVASVGEKWLRDCFFPTLSTMSTTSPTIQPSRTSDSSSETPCFSLVFPTAPEIRRSTTGYSAGSSIHMRTQSSAQRKQLDFIRPMLCHWAGDDGDDDPDRLATATNAREAGRRRAAPHIKTYTRFTDSSMTKIDWAMLTSANLSTQAWGSMTKDGHIRVCSYEIGVVVWPGLWGRKAKMVPVFKRNKPDEEEEEEEEETGGGEKGQDEKSATVRVGWRMPYDLPLVKYREGEMPWCASNPDRELDWMGRSWPGFGPG